jgi:CxxC-x17-CxxC domain-containing protein
MPYEDKTIVCAACGQEFIHSAADQERYATIGLTNEPKRCPECRAARRTRHSNRGPGQGPKPGRTSGGGGPRFGDRGGRPPGRGGRGGFGESRGPRELHDATCAACGQPTQVPFKPVEGRPVYCRDCFRSQRH